MPRRAGKQCCKPNCYTVADSGKSYCDRHKELNLGWENSHNGRTAAQRGYGHDWRKLRKLILIRDDYLCQEHLRLGKLVIANTVDHIKAKAHGGTDDVHNLESLCVECHKIKTTEDRRKSSRG